MTAAGGFAFAAAHGMIHRIHYHAANVRTPPQPSGAARLADTHVFMFVVSHLADGRHAFNEDLADFSGRQPHLGVTPFLGHQLTVSARRANQLSAASNLQLYIVNQRAQWNMPQGDGIARFDIRFLSADQNLSDEDILLGMGRIPELPAGTQSDGNAPTPIPADIAPGTYYFGILVDAEDDVAESDKSNNVMFAKIPVTIK